MTGDEHLTQGFTPEILDVTERHGHHRTDDRRTGQGNGLIRDAACSCQGVQEAPPGGYVVVPSPQPPGPPAVIVSAGEVKTLLTTLDEATEYKRDRAATCADQSCTSCQGRLQATRDYDQMAAQMLQAAKVPAAAQQPRSDRAGPIGSQPQAAAAREAGQ